MEWTGQRHNLSRRSRGALGTDSPRLTLSQQNLDPGLDHAAALPFDEEADDFHNASFGTATIYVSTWLLTCKWRISVFGYLGKLCTIHFVLHKKSVYSMF